MGSREVTVTACQTAFGWMGIAASSQGLLAVTLPQPTEEDALRPLLERWRLARLGEDASLAQFKEKLRRYFEGQEVAFDEPLDLSQATPFQRRVWQAVREIPRGETRSYGEIARLVDAPRAARAVGQALAANPLPIVIPCHRVINSDGGLGGFGGRVELKRRLLELEGAINERGEAGNRCASALTRESSTTPKLASHSISSA